MAAAKIYFVLGSITSRVLSLLASQITPSRNQSWYALSHCNDVSLWLSAYLNWSLTRLTSQAIMVASHLRQRIFFYKGSHLPWLVQLIHRVLRCRRFDTKPLSEPLLTIGSVEINLIELWINVHQYSCHKMNLKMWSAIFLTRLWCVKCMYFAHCIGAKYAAWVLLVGIASAAVVVIWITIWKYQKHSGKIVTTVQSMYSLGKIMIDICSRNILAVCFTTWKYSEIWFMITWETVKTLMMYFWR